MLYIRLTEGIFMFLVLSSVSNYIPKKGHWSDIEELIAQE